MNASASRLRDDYSCCALFGPTTAVKGTSKEYIGDDTEEIRKAVKHALQQCCQQLRAHLVKRNALRDQRERKKVLTKVQYTTLPTVSCTYLGVLYSEQSK